MLPTRRIKKKKEEESFLGHELERTPNYTVK
jgi:hypothetical protein